MMEKIPLLLAIACRGFFHQVQLHRALADLVLKQGNVGFARCNEAILGLLIIHLAAIQPRKPQMDEVIRNAIGAVCIAPFDDAVSDILAKLQFERR